MTERRAVSLDTRWMGNARAFRDLARAAHRLGAFGRGPDTERAKSRESKRGRSRAGSFSARAAGETNWRAGEAFDLVSYHTEARP